MKIMNINSVKIIAFVLAISNFVLMSCAHQVKKVDSTNKKEMAIVVDDTKNTLESKQKWDGKIVKKRVYKIKDTQKPIVYNLDTNGIVGFDDWTDYTIVNYEIEDIKRSNYSTTKNRLQHIHYRIANLNNTIPNWLKTEEVLEDINDIQKDYLELIKDSTASGEDLEGELEDFSEKFDDLKEELQETVDRYVKIHEDAIEEFNEELHDGNIEDAIEEYNEEIKELDKIVEQN